MTQILPVAGRTPYTTVTACRICGGSWLETVLDLGLHALASFSQSFPQEGPGHWQYAPLELVRCGSCGLVQLRHTVDRDTLFHRYWYRSGTSETMRAALADVAAAVKRRVSLEPNDIVLDIGANDGTLLSYFTSQRVGFEPSSITPEHGESIVRNYFTEAAWQDVMGEQKARVVLSIAMLYSVEKPVEFVADVAQVLAKDGLWLCQMNDLRSMVDGLAYDMIGHEHVAIYSLTTFERLLEPVGLQVFDLEWLPLNGGTLRFYVQHQGGPWQVDPSRHGKDQREKELSLALELEDFDQRVRESIADLRRRLTNLAKAGKRIHIKGASTRGSTIIQAAALDVPTIMEAADRDPAKDGFLFPGTSIPIVSEQRSRSDAPDYYLVLPYSYIDQFRKREKAFLLRGGQFILPVPKFRLVGAG